MRAIVLIIFCISVINIYSQNKIVTGRIYNQEGEILNGVSVCQENTFNCYFSDYMGVFHVLMDPFESNFLVIQEKGYKKLILEVSDTLCLPLKIFLEQDELGKIEQTEMVVHTQNKPRRNVDVSVFWSFKLEYTPMHYKEFIPQIGEYNVDVLNMYNLVPGVEIGFNFNRIYGGIEFGGLNNILDENNDSMNVELNRTKWSFSFGYNVLESRRFTITPNVALKVNRSRIINFAKEDQIQLEDYIEERNLDIRFNQLIGYAGVDISYNMFPKNAIFCEYYSIGGYGGYITKINNEPYVYSLRSRLRTNSRIGIDNYEFGFFFRLNY